VTIWTAVVLATKRVERVPRIDVTRAAAVLLPTVVGMIARTTRTYLAPCRESGMGARSRSERTSER
jgi:hypothetical protein